MFPLTVLENPNFWGLILGLPLSALIAVLTVYFQNRTRDRFILRNTKRFISGTIENTIASCELLLSERTRSGTLYFDLANFAKDEISVYLRQRENVFIIGDKQLEREVDSYFRKLNLSISRAVAFQQQIYGLEKEELEASERDQRISIAAKALEDNCNDIRMHVAVGRNIVANIKV
jgi:hypothetical protein